MVLVANAMYWQREVHSYYFNSSSVDSQVKRCVEINIVTEDPTFIYPIPYYIHQYILSLSLSLPLFFKTNTKLNELKTHRFTRMQKIAQSYLKTGQRLSWKG